MKGRQMFRKIMVAISAIIIAVISVVYVKNNNKTEIFDTTPNLQQSVDKRDYTGNTAYIKWRSSLGSHIDAFSKNGYVSYNLYCAQRNAYIGSSGGTFKEVYWNENAGIWRTTEENSYEKISWIKNYFWERTNFSGGYTNAERLEILKKADSSITLANVESVFDNSLSRYKIYQYITWKYTYGGLPPTGGLSSGAETKIYNAIIKLAESNYQNYNNFKLTVSKTDGDEGHYDENTNSYIWRITIDNTTPLDYVMDVKVDGNTTNDYTYENGVLTINGISAGNHNFAVSARTHYVASTSSIWWNSNLQKFIEITSSNNIELSDSVATEVSTSGKFNLNIRKVDEEGNPVNGASFKVNGEDLSELTNESGIVNIENSRDIASQKEEYKYTISELSSGGAFSKLKSDVGITLSSGLKQFENGGYYYAITGAKFDANGSNTYTTATENGKEITLTLESDFSESDGLTTITLIVPNTNEIYDLALTKTMVVPSTEYLEKSDVNRDGHINSNDATWLLNVKEEYETNDYDSEADRYKAVYEKVKGLEGYNTYYKYLIDYNLPEEDNNRYKGIYDRISTFIYDITGKEDGTIDEAKNEILSGAAGAGAGAEFNRINNISSYDLANTKGVTTAYYDMNKATRKVDRADVITYKITIYNEGYYDSKDIEITDYLPEGLKICDENGNTELTDGKITCTYDGKSYEWSVNGSEAKIVINDTIAGFESDKVLKSKSVYMTCVIDENIENGKILYNVAEISNSTPMDSNGNEMNVTDRDSHEDSIRDDTNNNVIDSYKSMFETYEEEEGSSYRLNKSTYDYEDDDDFERIVVVGKEFDLALRKSITKLGSDEQNMQKVPGTSNSNEGPNNMSSRLPKLIDQSVEACRNYGTAEYYHGKYHVEVSANDYVEYTIRVYNEGREDDYDGYASQITDYIPDYLEFVAVVDSDGSWVNNTTNGKYITTSNNFGHYEVEYDEANKKVIIDCVDAPKLLTKDCLNDIVAFNDSSMQTYYNGGNDDVSEIVYGYQEVRIICKVSEDAPAAKNITNIAEITADVAMNSQNDEVEINDRDSEPETIHIGTESGQINLSQYYYTRGINDTYKKYYKGNQDDDDFETVYIVPNYQPREYKLKVRKIDNNGNPLQNAIFSLKKEYSKNLFENGGAVDADGYTSECIEKISQYEVRERYNGGYTEFTNSYTLKEESAPEGYSKLKNAINIDYNCEVGNDSNNVTAQIKSINIYADNESKSVSFDYEQDLGKDKTIEGVLLEDGKTANIIISLDDSGKITIQVENTKIEGSFDLKLVKRKDYDEDGDGINEPLAGAWFNVKINDGTSDIVNEKDLISGTDGTISSEKLNSIKITDDKLTYTITVTETKAPDGYIAIGSPATYTATSTVKNGNYVLETKQKAQLDNEYVIGEVKENEILIEAKNRVEPVIHKGIRKIRNQDAGYDGDEIQTWVVNSSVPKGIGDYVQYIIDDEIDFEKNNVNEKRIEFIGLDSVEVSVLDDYEGNKVKDLVAGTDYKASFDDDKKVLTITFIDVNEDDEGFKAGRDLPEGKIIEVKYKTKFRLDENGLIIGLQESIKNKAVLTFGVKDVVRDKTKESEEPEVHTGGVGVFKFDNTTTPPKALEGAHFKIARTEADARAGNYVKVRDEEGNETEEDVELITGSDGSAEYEGLEFGEDAEKVGIQPTNEGKDGFSVYKYDWTKVQTKYFLVETEVPVGYVMITDPIEVTVSYNKYERKDLTTYHKVGNTPMVYEGNYRVKVIKYGKYEDGNLKPISGVKFSASRTINGNANELVSVEDTDELGATYIGDTVQIDKNKTSDKDIDTYVIKEESMPEDSEFYIGLNKNITLNIKKDSIINNDGSQVTNIVKSIEMAIEGENVTTIEKGKKYTAKVTKDGQELEVTAELIEESDGGQLITLTVENPHKVGNFDLDIVKKIKGTNPAQYLPGAGFKVSIKADGEALVDGKGNSLDGSHEFFVDGKGKLVINGINIKKSGITYAVEIEESTVPTGYIGIGDKITFNATSTIYKDKLGLDRKTETISNDVKLEIKENEIWVDVENRPEPEIHKGVKTVENQDSGYDKNEVQTWVINTTVPSGVSKYTKYEVTDTIDYEKTNVAEKRIAFINEDKPEDNVTIKYKGTDTKLEAEKDYKVDFDKENKVLTISFINDSFDGGKSLNENTTLEITYNTMFTLDENGNIIGLNQSIPNQAHLTFNGNGKEEKTKDSEIPEVHTGGVGVFKYEDLNKNGKYDDGEPALENAHFKIVRDEEEAKKAVAAVLDSDEETLKTIKFVKVRDEEGKETDKDVELITGKDGSAEYEGLEFGEDAMNKVEATKHKDTGANVYVYDWSVAETKYYLVETEAPEEYYLLNHAEEFKVGVNSFEVKNLTTYYQVANKKKIYDLSLRKFITHVKGEDIDKEVTERIPRVTLTDEFKDKENDEVTTAIYEHTKEPVVVQQGNVVTYTIRVYNEGPESAYASIVKDDIPDGVEFIQYTEGDGSVNDTYRWKLVDENDQPVTDVSKAKYIITDYLSKEQGENNLLKAFDSETMNELDYRDLKVQFKVTEPNTSERIITNYAQISKMTNSEEKIVEDRDSTPNKWINGEDDQDIENIRLLYFDLALRKWVTKARVIQNGQETIFETGHKAEDNPEDVVKVDLKKSKLNSVVVKFEYQIRITNEGRIGGWCDEITDHIPDGLTFDQADNSIWTVVDEKTITTDALKNTYLEPGESAEVTVVLRWENSGDNLGIKVNIAEISKDRNEYGVHDIDSTPGNYKWGEDDIDDAPVMLALKTGNAVLGYAILGLVVVSTIAVGVIAIKKVNN